jgi:HAD superfamily hydrolase (TIGR01484 family)
VDDAIEKNYGVIVVGEKDVAVLDPQGQVDEIFRQHLAVENLDKAKPVEEVLQQRIMQITPFFNKEYEVELMARVPGCTSGRWHPAFTDVTALGADKGEGLLAMAKYFGLNPDHTMAFGDGGNDSTMVRKAGVGIAMGNAIDELKAEADYITASVDDEGVRKALQHFGLI